MSSTEIISWVNVTANQEFCLEYSNRTSHVIQEMTTPHSQFPSLVFFIGRKSRDAILRYLFPRNNIRRGYRDGFINLRLDSSTMSADHPLLFADSDPHTPIPRRISSNVSRERDIMPIDWKLPSDISITNLLYARLAFLFSDVICIFADDIGGLESVALYISHWIKLGSASSLPRSIRPRIVIVQTEDKIAVTESVLEIKELEFRLEIENKQNRDDVFSSIMLLHLQGAHLSPLARHHRLKDVLLKEVDMARHSRIKKKVLFSATHFEAFFRQAIQHTTRSFTQPFDFIERSRINNKVGLDYQVHLSRFLRLGYEQHISPGVLNFIVASSLLMDAYPPRMHGMIIPFNYLMVGDCEIGFDPMAVFRKLYYFHCFTVFTQLTGSTEIASNYCHDVEKSVRTLFPAIELGFETAAELHADNMASFLTAWKQLKSNKTCFYCIRRKPEYMLSCSHAICEICVQIFGSVMSDKSFHYNLSKCILCVHEGNITARLKPATAGCRLLSVDGGGVRGIVPLEFLNLLQQVLGDGLPLQDLVDEAFGTSSGGLIVIGIFLKNWTVTHCIRQFDFFTRKFFGMHLTKGKKFITRARDYLRCWLSDGCYDDAAFESLLKLIFGEKQRLFDTNSSNASGTKVAVTATTISDATPYIFSNYNGQGTRAKTCGYKHVRPDKIEDEPFIWEAARVTSAAPVLFKPAHITALGSFQDGGLKHNNPVDLALWECGKIWSSNTVPDVVLSLGTGKNDDIHPLKAPHFRHVFNDGFIPRLCRSFMSSLDGERAWRDLINRLDDNIKADYFRFNISISAEETSIDDANQMENLRRSVSLLPNGLEDRINAASALLTASFYFELQSIPCFENGNYACHGTIRCRNNFDEVLKFFETKSEFSVNANFLGFLSSSDICTLCHMYSKAITFNVRQLEDTVTIKLKLNAHEKRKISGFPHNMLWFIKQQQLDAVFGTSYHDSPRINRCQMCRGFQPTSVKQVSTKRKINEFSTIDRKRLKQR